MIFNKDKDEAIFLTRIVKLTPEEIIALAKILEVRLSTVDTETGKYEVREATDIVDNLVAEFRKLAHKERKIILKAMEKKNGIKT